MTTRRSLLAFGGAAVAAAATVPAVSAPAAARPHGFHPEPGSGGVGDPLFPTLGNGGYQVTHYDLTFDFTPVTYDFTATVRISARATQDLSAFNLDTDGHTIDAVTVAGRPATWQLAAGQSGQELTVTPARPIRDHQAFTVEIRYRGNGKAPRLGLTGWRFGSDGGFASAAQSSRADTFLPCNDTPSDKATWTFHLSAPEGYVATANGELTHRTPRADGSTVWHFALRERMATELIGIAVVKGTYLYGHSHRGLPLRHIVPRGKEDTYAPIVARTADHLAWLEAKFGRYPFSVYGVHIYDGYTDALENQTLSLFGTNWFKPNAQGQPGYETTMVHELVHQWFGDSVTPHDWQQAWLNEGPAVYYAGLYGEERGWSVLADKMKATYEKLDAVRAADGPPGLPKALGGTNIYDGGALVLYALNQRIGRRSFDAVMREWVRRFKDSTYTSEQFIRHTVDTTRDRSLDPFLRDWLFGAVNPPMPGHPDWKATA
ncbi:M1 family metallopeptidase [Streptomyces drozdowiczii]|uniref:Aminopeptidase N n=1 Tax=Streptomyces drozdowiczii TaxID=202862 RepID=A0ABY6PM06_9ACTN|nr:M1 family metallopeptidase [Streptomyces drozdowiczii]MCX0247335.1 M1 family metallopeptidase [Streptomyces drozdowiczii]UZK53258.1 M1 family metallopeptidase [Streptomyces drozdowiczii]